MPLPDIAAPKHPLDLPGGTSQSRPVAPSSTSTPNLGS
jgi:hypothetical protein